MSLMDSPKYLGPLQQIMIFFKNIDLFFFVKICGKELNV